jgi:hypothetical protein
MSVVAKRVPKNSYTPLYNGVIVSELSDNPYTSESLLLLISIKNAVKVRSSVLTALHEDLRQTRMTRPCKVNSGNCSERQHRLLETWRFSQPQMKF